MNTTTTTKTKLIDSAIFFRELHEQVILSHVDELAEIAARGDQMVVLVYKPAQDPAVGFARTLGWDGEAPTAVFRMSRRFRRALAANVDALTARWLTRKHGVRMLVISGAGSLLLNLDDDGVWGLEPGSLDIERAAASN